MKTFQKFLIVLGVFVFAYNASIIVHELGHALNVVATGGQVHYIKVTPFSWSYVRFASNPEPMAATWGGFLWETIFGVSAFFVLWIAKSRLSLFGVVLAIASLAGTGIYMLIGAVLRIGDSASLIESGVPPPVLIVIGSVLLLLALPLILPLGVLLDVGKGKNRFTTTLAVFSPIAAYLLVMLAFNLWRNPDEWLMWTASVGCGLLLVVLICFAVHWTWPWCAGSEARRRAIPVNWRVCLLSLVLGGGVVAAEYLAFPKPAPVRVQPKPILWWFQDEQNYAGGLFLDDDAGDAVFWKIRGAAGRKALPGYPWDGRWSSKLGRLIVLTKTGLLAVSPSGEMESLLKRDFLAPPLRMNDDGSKALLLGRDVRREGYYLAAIDLATGAVSSREIESLASGMTFISADEAVAAFPDHRLRVSVGDSGQWRFEKIPNPVANGKIVAAMDGAVVVQTGLPSESGMSDCRLSWNGKSVDLPDIQGAFPWRDRLYALTWYGAVYQVDSSMNAKLVLPVREEVFRVGRGVADRGFWIAYSNGVVVVCGDTQQRVRLKFPSSMP